MAFNTGVYPLNLGISDGSGDRLSRSSWGGGGWDLAGFMAGLADVVGAAGMVLWNLGGPASFAWGEDGYRFDQWMGDGRCSSFFGFGYRRGFG